MILCDFGPDAEKDASAGFFDELAIRTTSGLVALLDCAAADGPPKALNRKEDANDSSFRVLYRHEKSKPT
jgi:hypothetical protein